MHQLLNNTKWEEIRQRMYQLGNNIQLRTKDVESGYVSDWDGEWYYHFKLGGYATIEWVEILTPTNFLKESVLNVLKEIHVPGKILSISIMVYGYSNHSVDYL